MLDIPDQVENIRIKKKILYDASVKKVVIMVVDALRWDFLTGPDRYSTMPITSNLMSNNSSCLLQAKGNPPTVTMPRIKAMMTGAVSNFIDVALNFGNSPVTEDSLLLQAMRHGRKIHFYGDDTWLKMFPGLFQLSEGTTSFYVNDFTEVDNNVTRNLAKELNNEDWSLLILHYLGLDHIGHVAGPFSPLIKPKLGEMDKIIGEIHAKMQLWQKNGLPALFVVCGDHGMKDSGGHGGSTPEETLVPFLVFGANCPLNIDKPNAISQVDVASILAVMLGLPIPSSNIGSVPPIMLSQRSDSSKLFILYYNAQQVLKHFKFMPDYKMSQAYKYYENAVKLHVDWLSNQKDKSIAEKAIILYNNAFQHMKEILIHSSIDYDLPLMAISIIFMGHVILLLANGENLTVPRVSKVLQWTMGTLISYFVLMFAWEPDNFISQPKNNNFFLNTMIVGIVLINSCFASTISLFQFLKKKITSFSLPEFFFSLGMIVHVASLSSSSFVEEEHQTWYFFWVTMLILLFLNTTTKISQLSVSLFMSLVIHRVMRKLNSTGNKYANAPDIADWLTDRENKTAMTMLLLLALGLLVMLGYICEEKKYKVKCTMVHGVMAVCIYLRHMANKTVAQLPLYFQSRGVVEVHIFWISIIFYTFLWMYRLCQEPIRNNLRRSLLRFLLQLWTIVSSMLHKPYNVVLLPVQILVSYVINDALEKNEKREDLIIYIYMWTGNVFYFYQGNSNSLATIDVAAGYIGMESYRPFVTGTFLVINTYSAPVLAYLILVYRSTFHNSRQNFSEKLHVINRNYAFWRFLPMAVYAMIVTFQRFHLFVWSVFSPKLLYEAVHCAVIFAVILLVQIICSCIGGK